MRILSVHPSVCSSVKRVTCDKTAIRLNKVYYKVSLCENRQRQSYKAFVRLSIRVKMIAGGHPLLRENLAETCPPLAKRQLSIYIRSQRLSHNT